MKFTASNTALKQILKLMNEDKDKTLLGLRISINGGGCSGFLYTYKLENSIDDDDYIKDYTMDSKNIKIIIENSLLIEFLNGSTLEFVKELGSSYFQITNPNASAKCGCGNSFTI